MYTNDHSNNGKMLLSVPAECSVSGCHTGRLRRPWIIVKQTALRVDEELRDEVALVLKYAGNVTTPKRYARKRFFVLKQTPRHYTSHRRGLHKVPNEQHQGHNTLHT